MPSLFTIRSEDDSSIVYFTRDDFFDLLKKYPIDFVNYKFYIILFLINYKYVFYLIKL